MEVEFPLIDFIMHGDLDRMSYPQQEYVRLLNQGNNFINSSFKDLLDRISREYNSCSVLELLNLVRITLETEELECEDAIEFDDFVNNATLVSQSLKTIVNNPGRRLIKIDKNLPANKVTRFDSKTMTWLSRRPGATIEEKIAPKNVIPTKVTYFTADTMENRHAMYLFSMLYDNLYEKVYPNGKELKCEECPHKDKKCYETYEQLRTIIFLKSKIIQSDLHRVPKQKQLRQNNKLLSDKEYKVVWDAVRSLDYFEENCKNIWDNLKNRYHFIMFLIVASKIANLKDIKVFDNQCTVVDNEGVISLQNEDRKVNTISFYDAENDRAISVSLTGESLEITTSSYKSENGVTYALNEDYKSTIDLSNIFSVFDEIEQKEKELDEISKKLESLKKELQDEENKLMDYEANLVHYTSFVTTLNRIINKEGKRWPRSEKQLFTRFLRKRKK